MTVLNSDIYNLYTTMFYREIKNEYLSSDICEDLQTDRGVQIYSLPTGRESQASNQFPEISSTVTAAYQSEESVVSPDNSNVDIEIGIIETVDQVLQQPLDAPIEEVSVNGNHITGNDIDALIEEVKATQKSGTLYVELPTLTYSNSLNEGNPNQYIPSSVLQLADELGIDSGTLTTHDINKLMTSVARYYNKQFPSGHNGEDGEVLYESMRQYYDSNNLPMPDRTKDEIIHELTYGNYSAEQFAAMREKHQQLYANDFPRFVDGMVQYYQVPDRRALRRILLSE